MSIPIKITKKQYEVLRILAELRPYERVLIVKNKEGKVFKYSIQREQAQVLTETEEFGTIEALIEE